MTDSELDAIEARANAATPGPWEFQRVGNQSGDTLYRVHAFVEPANLGLWAPPGEHQAEANGLFAAAARTDVPALVEEVRRLHRILSIITYLEHNEEARLFARAALDPPADR